MKTIVVPKIPIFITARGNNSQALDRNTEALKYASVLIDDMGLFNQTYIISDNDDLLKHAKNLGFINIIYQPCDNEDDVAYLDYIGIYNFYRKTGWKPDWFILLALNQIFKDNTLIYNCIRNIDNSYDIVASYTEISDRSSFFIYDDKIVSTGRLITHERKRQKMIDAAIYAIKSDFAVKIMEARNEGHDPSSLFWQGKIKFFENTSIYTDIVNLSDIRKYEKTEDILNKVKQIKES